MLHLHVEGDLDAVYRIQMPVPRWPVDGQLQLAATAIFHLHFEERWCRESPAGWMPLSLLEPTDPFAPNMAPGRRGATCLGENLPPGILVREIVLLGYHAVALQTCQLDESDPAGVLNLEACDYFRRHPEYLPLTHAGLLDDWQPPKSEVPS